MKTIHIRDAAQVRKGLVVDAKAKHYRRMRQAIWLYLYLLLAAPPGSGRRLLDPEAVARAMGLTEATVRSWLGHLRTAGYVTTERSGRQVWVQITKWIPRELRSVPSPAAPRAKTPLTPEALARVLGEPPESPVLARIVRESDPQVLQAALERTLAVPDSQIRKSRLALLHYLLKHHQ